MDYPLKELVPVSNNNTYQRNNHSSSFVPSALSLFWLLKLFINKVQNSFLHLTQHIQDTFFLSSLYHISFTEDARLIKLNSPLFS